MSEPCENILSLYSFTTLLILTFNDHISKNVGRIFSKIEFYTNQWVLKDGKTHAAFIVL